MATLLDSDILITFLKGGENAKALQTKNLIKKLQKADVKATINELTLAETCMILESYEVPPDEIARHLIPLLDLDGIVSPDKGDFIDALLLYSQTSLSIIESMQIIFMKKAKKTHIISFNKTYDNIEGIIRSEP
jgi:predicted nucleic-acid-binding protein